VVNVLNSVLTVDTDRDDNAAGGVQFICGNIKTAILAWTSTKPYCAALRSVQCVSVNAAVT